jgi:ABC-type Fe3+-hydroxamate transport system substrate-binding protein
MRNIFADRKEPYMMVTLESIASRNPELILSLNRKKQDYTGSAAWQTLAAVRDKRILDKDALDWNAVVRQGPRMVDGIEQLAELVSKL